MPDFVYVLNDDPQHFSIKYVDNGDPAKRADLESGWKHFNRTDPGTGQTYKIDVRPTNPNKEVIVDRFFPSGHPPGRYRLDVFVPGKHATSRKAIYSVLHSRPSEGGLMKVEESIVAVDMLNISDVWKTLGVYYLDPSRHTQIGRIRQYDMSQEDPPREISFGPVRWVSLARLPGGGLGYDAPVGTEVQRSGQFPVGGYEFGKYPIWVGEWFDFTPFLEWYIYGYHTGADLNLPGSSGADKGKPVYTISEGIVTYAGKAGSWGRIIVVEHPEALVTHPDGHIERQKVYSRYGHMDENMLVKTGDVVARGENIGFIGLAWGMTSGWHLHFDVSYSDVLKTRPGHWPDLTTIRNIRAAEYRGSRKYKAAKAAIMRDVVKHYVDPLPFILDNHGM